MTVSVGDTMPSAKVLHQTGDDVHEIDIGEFCKGRKVVLFGLPGAYTSTCSAAHLPSFIRTADAFRDRGVDVIACVAVNDVRVMEHWGRTSGADAAGIMMLADWDSELTKKLGIAFSVPAIGFKDRMQRIAMLIEDGEIKVIQREESAGACDLTTGETLLESV